MSFKPFFQIGHLQVGGEVPVLVIAEAGVNHFGDEAKARDLIDLAADSGADVFKTQAFITDQFIASSQPDWRERMRPKEVNFDFLEKIKLHCDERKILFMCTAHNESVLPWLNRLEVPAFKIGSGERCNWPFLRKMASEGKPLLISTGMYEERHIKETLDVAAELGCDELGFLHCVTSYPTPYKDINLRAMEILQDLFPGPVGYSDHTEGHHVSLAAVARGAKIIEKHISLDFDVPNAQDWKVSAGPDDFSILVKEVREVEASLGQRKKEIQPSEAGAVNWALKSLVAAYDLPRGVELTEPMILAKRPGGGLPPARMSDLLGRRLKRTVSVDSFITNEDLEIS